MKKIFIAMIVSITTIALCSCGESEFTGYTDKQLNEEIKNAYEAGYEYAVEEFNDRIAEDISWDKVPSALYEMESEGGFDEQSVKEYFFPLIDEATSDMEPEVGNYDSYTDVYE